MSEMEDLRSFLRSVYATENATTMVAALPIQSMPSVKVHRSVQGLMEQTDERRACPATPAFTHTHD